MNHALIIEQDIALGNRLSSRLSELGFESFDQVSTEDDAIAAAEMRSPDLILVGDSLEAGDAVTAARRICDKHDIPVIMVTADSIRAKRRLADGGVLDGPFAFNKFPEAIAAAKNRSRHHAQEW